MKFKNNQETITGLKNAYSILSQAYNNAVIDNGTPDNWNLDATGSITGAENLLNVITKYLKVSKVCGDETGCYPNVDYKTVNGYSNGTKIYDTKTNHSKAQLANGMLLCVWVRNKDCASDIGGTPQLDTVCADAHMDINGPKGPNQWGVDYFQFYMTKNGIIPTGTPTETSSTFSGQCANTAQETTIGYSCSAWVLQNNNLDYLKCPSSLSWTGSTTCP